MTAETAEALIEALAISLNATSDVRNRIAALEKTLAGNERALYLSYQTNLENENRDSSPLLSQESLADLQAALVQRE
jgi:hypothetical protein